MFGRVDTQLHCLPAAHLPETMSSSTGTLLALPRPLCRIGTTTWSSASVNSRGLYRDLPIGLPEAQESDLAEVDVGAWAARAVIAPDRRIYRLQQSRKVGPRERLVDSPHHFHVPLRHRLLPEPHGFEGLVAGESNPLRALGRDDVDSEGTALVGPPAARGVDVVVDQPELLAVLRVRMREGARE